MPGEKANASVLAEDLLSPLQDFHLGTADIGEQSLRRQGWAEPVDQIDDPADRRRQDDELAAANRIGGIGVAEINRGLASGTLENGARSQPMIRPTNPRFFRAKASDPPIRPVPMIVIWRMGISCVHHDTGTEKAEKSHQGTSEQHVLALLFLLRASGSPR